MRRAEATIALGLALWLGGCVFHGKQQAARVPPPPAPPALAAPAPPLSTPQTQVQLPPPQPIDPAALAVSEASPEPTPAAPPEPTPGPSKPAAAAPPPKPEPAAPAAQIAPPERPRIQEIVPAEEQRRLHDSVEARRKELQQWLQQAQGRTLNSQERELINRIQSFLKASDDAAARGDFRTADALAERAQILVRDLQNGK
jgi:hypothetical protein